MKYNKIGLISLGCGKNLVNSEQMLYLISDAGYILTDEPAQADVMIVNTCGFIDSAKSEAIDTILDLAQYKQSGELKKILVAGCLAERYKTQILQEMPEVDGVIGCGSFSEIVSAIKATENDETPVLMGDIDAPLDETQRVVTGIGSWTYLKIADGCDNRCSYCIIPDLRGKYRSRPMESVIAEARELAHGGIHEVLVIAQDITRYGTDLYGKHKLAELLKELCLISEIEWIRLHYLYPDDITDELIELIANESKILKYLDIPIQHVNNKILKAMNRRGTGEEIRELFHKLRERIPGLVIRTSLITGLPGESEAEFDELCNFLRNEQIERVGVFPYSPEEGTLAAEMPDRPDEETAVRRASIVEDIQEKIMHEFNSKRIGRIERVICEGYDEVIESFYGRSYAESPDIDGRILIRGDKYIIGSFIDVRICGEQDGELFGEIV